MARVEADGDPRIVEGVEHLADLLEASAHTSAKSRVVLDQEPRRPRLRALEHVLQVLGDGWKPRLEAGALVRTRVEDDAVDAEVVRRLEVAGQRALGALAQRRVVARQVDQVHRVEVKGRMTVLRGRLFERGDARLVELGRAPETGRRRMHLDRFRPHRFGSLEGQMEAARRVDVSPKQRH